MKKILMKKILTIALTMLGATPFLLAAPLELTSIQFLEKQSISVGFVGMQGAPDAQVDAKVTYNQGQAKIDLSYKSIKPAILFGGDITCYVAWAVTRDGRAENMGELLAAKPSGKISAITGKKNFALMVTAEPYFLVERPSQMVMWINTAPVKKDVETTGFSFAAFGPVPDRAMDSIAEIAWESNQSLELLQARKAYELAERHQADIYARAIYVEAGESLDDAEILAKKNKTSKQLLDASRESVDLSNEAINISRQRKAGLELMALIDQRQRKTAELESQAKAAEMRVQALAHQRKMLEKEIAEMDKKTQSLEQTTADLSAMLGTALSMVADARQTAQGYVVSLPDILFDLNQASLRSEAQIPLAKLAGILLIMQNFTVVVEGYTDSTGSEEFNKNLSKNRADSVATFMADQGISNDRLSTVGFGPENPKADNETEEGRRMNRRVELVLTRR